MELQDFVLLLEQVHGALMQVIGMMKATVYKQSKRQPPTNKEEQLNNLLKDWRPDDNCSAPIFLPEETMRKYKGKTIKKRADGRYWTRFYRDGKQHSVYGRTANECINNLKKALKKPQNSARSGVITLGEWLKQWLELYKVGKIRPSTLKTIRYYLRSTEELQNKPMNNISAIEWQKFFNALAEQYPRKCTAVYTILNDAYKRALRNKLIKENPLDNVEVKHIKRRPSRALTLEEERRFVAACNNDPHGALYLCCLYQGLRIGEAAALDADDIDFEARTLTISKSIDRDGTVGAPKTETSKRIMPLFARTAEILPHKKEGKLFEYSKGTYQNFMNKLCKKLQLTGISVHSLRHTFATRCAEAGVAPKVVQKWLGHSTVNMTLDIYTHVNTDFEQSEVQKFDTYFDTYFC